MIKIAKIEDNLIVNIENHSDSADIPDGYVNVTSIPYDIGWPIVNGVPEPPPSPLHTLTGNNSGWELTPENETIMEITEKTANNLAVHEKLMALEHSAMEHILEFLHTKFNADPDWPAALTTLYNDWQEEAANLIE